MPLTCHTENSVTSADGHVYNFIMRVLQCLKAHVKWEIPKFLLAYHDESSAIQQMDVCSFVMHTVQCLKRLIKKFLNVLLAC